MSTLKITKGNSFKGSLYNSLYVVAVFFLININSKAQGIYPDKILDTTAKDKKLYYRFTIGAGIGSGYPFQEDDFSLSGMIEFALLKQNSIYGIGIRNIHEFEILYTSNVPNSVNSVDITYGKLYKKKSLFCSISAGIGLVYRCTKGKLLSRTSDNWLSSYSKYEKITRYSIGLPVSAKLFSVPSTFYGFGIELYANINTKNIFYGINLCSQFGKLKSKVKRTTN